jgi:hypothetical protein
MFNRIVLLLLVVAALAFLVYVVYTRVGSNPIAYLMGIIGLAAGIVVYLQFLKDW